MHGCKVMQILHIIQAVIYEDVLFFLGSGQIRYDLATVVYWGGLPLRPPPPPPPQKKRESHHPFRLYSTRANLVQLLWNQKSPPPPPLLVMSILGGGGGVPIQNEDLKIFIPKRKWTSIVSSNWQQKFLYFHYKSVKLDILGKQNKMNMWQSFPI